MNSRWWLVLLAAWLVGCLAQQDAVVTRPVQIREVVTIEAGLSGGDTVTLMGRVIDVATRKEVRLGQVVVESSRGAWRFDAPFQVAVPAMSVITLTVAAPGYQIHQEVMKVHYRRDVTLTVDIPLEALPVGVD